MVIFLQLIHFHPSHLQTKMIDTSFCVPVGLFFDKLKHYFSVSISTNTFFCLFIVTLKKSDTSPLKIHTDLGRLRKCAP